MITWTFLWKKCFYVITKTSMQKCHHLGALALLGALLLYFVLWPICCCAAKPTWSPQHHKSPTNEAFLAIANTSSDTMSTNITFDGFLNVSSASDDNETMLHANNSTENVLKNQDQPTSSIYDLFVLGKSKSKKRRASSDQILSRTDRSVHLNSSNNKNNSVSGAKRVKNNKTKSTTLDRNERSANLSHITGSARKIQLYIKNRFLQLLPDGSVNGTTDDSSDYSELTNKCQVFILTEIEGRHAIQRKKWATDISMEVICVDLI